MKRFGLTVLLLLAGCGPGSLSAPATSSVTASVSPAQVDSAGVLFGPECLARGCVAGAPGNRYTLALVSADGRTVGTATASRRSIRNLRAATPATMPPYSMSHDRLYYLDGDNTVRYLTLDGSTGVATTVPGSATSESSFAVSPDDHRIAVATIDYRVNQATLELSVRDLDGANRVDIFTSTSSYVWPVGWHDGLLVLAVGVAAVQNIPTNPSGSWGGYHVVDPSSGLRKVTANCGAMGPATPAGSACLSADPSTGQVLSIDDWTGKARTVLTRPLRSDSLTVGAAALSPGGSTLVFVSLEGPGLGNQLELLDVATGSIRSLGPAQPGAVHVPWFWMDSPSYGWIDNTHFLTEGLDQPATIIDTVSGSTTPLKAFGQPVGRVPGDL